MVDFAPEPPSTHTPPHEIAPSAGRLREAFHQFIATQIREIIPAWIRQCRVQLKDGGVTVYLVPITDPVDPRLEELKTSIERRIGALAGTALQFVTFPRGTILDREHDSCLGESCTDLVGPFARLESHAPPAKTLTNGQLQQEIIRTLPSGVELVRDYRYRANLPEGIFDFLILRGTVAPTKDDDLRAWCRRFEETYGIVVFFDRLSAVESIQQQLVRMAHPSGMLTSQQVPNLQRVIDAFYGAIPETVSYLEHRPKREDLTSRQTVAIDGPGTQDREDVVAAEQIPGTEQILVTVGFIDVTDHVRPGDPVDTYAERVGATVYGRNRIVPTLGKDLAFGAANFALGEERPAWVCEMVIDAEGKTIGTRIVNAMLRCNHHLTPETFDTIINTGAGAETTFGTLAEVSNRLRRRRVGEQPIIRISADGIASSIVAELMISAKAHLARFLSESGVPAIFRVHAPPRGKARDVFIDRLRDAGISGVTHDWFDNPIRLTGLLQALEDKRERALLHEILDAFILRSRFDTVNLGHRGIGVDAYLEIKPREATGLKNQFQLRSALHGNGSLLKQSDLQSFAERRNRQRREQPGVSYRLRFLEDLSDALTQQGKLFRGKVVADYGDSYMVEVVGFQRWGVFHPTPEQREQFTVGSPLAIRLDGFDARAMRFVFSKPTEPLLRLIESPTEEKHPRDTGVNRPPGQ